MARKYSRGAGAKVEEATREMKEGRLRSGHSGKRVTSRKQAIAIGLSEARKEGEKVPGKKSSKKSVKKSAAAKKTTRKTAAKRKMASKRSAMKRSADRKSAKRRTPGTGKQAKRKSG